MYIKSVCNTNYLDTCVNYKTKDGKYLPDPLLFQTLDPLFAIEFASLVFVWNLGISVLDPYCGGYSISLKK